MTRRRVTVEALGRFQSLATNAALAGLSLAVSLALVEAGARVMAARRRAQRAARGIVRYDPELGWDNRPGGRMRIRRAEFDVTIAINAAGLRGPEPAAAKPAGARRVLLLGDSFAQGYYVAEAQTARAELERRLTAAGCAVEVLNEGVAGYSTDQEYLAFTRDGPRFAPDVVVLFFYYNDLYYNTVTHGSGGEGKPVFELRGGALVLRGVPVAAPSPATLHGSVALRWLADRLVESPGPREVLSRAGLLTAAEDEPLRELWPFSAAHEREVADMWRRTEALLRALRDAVAARGGRLVVLYVPPRFEITGEPLDPEAGRRADVHRVVRRLRRACRALGLPLADPRHALGASEAAGRRAYYREDAHWNATGNALVAAVLESALRPLACCSGPGCAKQAAR